MKWKIAEVDEALALELAVKNGLKTAVGKYLVSQGYNSESVGEILSPSLKAIVPISQICNLEKATLKIRQHLDCGDKIGLFGDYDADGLTSIAIVATYLKSVGATLKIGHATRKVGYGFLPAQVAQYQEAGCKLIITLDCGTHDHKTIELANMADIDVVSLDHHQCSKEQAAEWPGAVLVNPAIDGVGEGLATAGLAWYLVAAMFKSFGKGISPMELLDLAAVGSIADMAKMDTTNRVLCKHGLRRIASAPRPGFKALLSTGRFFPKNISDVDISFGVAPVINAAGRLGDPRPALYLLSPTADEDTIKECKAINEKRKEIQRENAAVVLKAVKDQLDSPFLMVCAEGLNPGVVGVVAHKLVDLYNKPSAVVSLPTDGSNYARGSVRSPDGVNVYEIMKKCAKLFIRFGGHKAAGGFTFDDGNRKKLHKALCFATKNTVKDLPEPVIDVAAQVNIAEVDRELFVDTIKAGPYGIGRPEPVYCMKDVDVDDSRTIGKEGSNHTTLQFSKDKSSPVRGVWFGAYKDDGTGRVPEADEVVDVAFTLMRDNYSKRVTARVVDIKRRVK